MFEHSIAAATGSGLPKEEVERGPDTVSGRSDPSRWVQSRAQAVTRWGERTVSSILYGFRLLQWLEDKRRGHGMRERSPFLSRERVAAGSHDAGLRVPPEELAASIAHEIRSPLSAIRMWMFSIRESVAYDAELDRKCRLVAEEVTRVEGIVRRFLEDSQGLHLQLEPHDVSRIVARTLESIGPRLGNTRLRAEYGALPAALVDVHLLQQVLTNLLDNAIEAAGPLGRVDLSADVEAAARGHREIVIRVRDSGPGVPESIRSRIFEPFVSSKPGGTGLGLCIASRIVTRHGGALSLECSGDQPTCFAVRIPAEVRPC